MRRTTWAIGVSLACALGTLAQEAPLPPAEASVRTRTSTTPRGGSPDLLSGEWSVEGREPGQVRFVRAGAYRWRYLRGSERGTAWQLGSVVLMRPAAAADSAGFFRRVEEEEWSPEAASPRDALYRWGSGGELVHARGGEARRSGEQLRPAREGGNHLWLLIDGPEAYPAMYAAIARARRSICVQFFSWFDDQTGRRFADALIAKARQGVQVKVLMEAFPQKGGLGWKTGPYLRAGGVDVMLHHKMTEGLKNSFFGFFRRLWNGLRGKKEVRERRGFLNHDHRKLLVVDGREAFTGGMNVGDKYELGTDWHDVHCQVLGPAVTEMEAMFWERWRAAGGKGFGLPPVSPVTSGPYPVQVLENLPGIRLQVTDRYLAEIAAARSEILIENPYFLYDPVVDALKRKAGQGVRTIVIIPSNDLNDEALARDAMFWSQNDIVRAGVQLRKYRDRMCHGKVAVFDRRVSTVGTTNLDRLAMVNNAELNLFVPDARFARVTIQRVFIPDVCGSDAVVVQKLSWWERLKGAVMYSLRRFL